MVFSYKENIKFSEKFIQRLKLKVEKTLIINIPFFVFTFQASSVDSVRTNGSMKNYATH